MGVHFSYRKKKQSIFDFTRIPGRSIPGVNGVKGDDGENGPQIYFTDYNPSDDYTKELVINRVRNNITLSSGSYEEKVKMEYKPGDLIVSRNLHVYKLTHDGENYDLELLGEIHNNVIHESDEDHLINNIMFTEFLVTDKHGNGRSSKWVNGAFNIPIISNRSMDASVDYLRCLDIANPITEPKYVVDKTVDSSVIRKTYSEADKRTYGFSFIPFIHVLDASLADDFDFYLRISIPIEKSPQSNSYTLSKITTHNYTNLDPAPQDKQNVFKFYKHAEVKLNVVTPSTGNYNLTPDASSYNVTDIVCDKLHPAGNNIASNYIRPGENRLYEIGLLYPSDKVFVKGLENFDASKNDAPYMTVENINCMTYNQQDASTTSYLKTDTSIFTNEKAVLAQLQYSGFIDKDNIYVPNYRSGDSAYFSQQTVNYYPIQMFDSSNLNGNTYFSTYATPSEGVFYDSYVHNILCSNPNSYTASSSQLDSLNLRRARVNRLSEWMSSVIMDFFLSKKNVYEITCVKKSTGETFILKSRVPEITKKYSNIQPSGPLNPVYINEQTINDPYLDYEKISNDYHLN